MNKLISRQVIKINEKLTGDTSPNTTLEAVDCILQEVYTKNEEWFYIFKDTISKAAKFACEIYKQKLFVHKNLATAVFAMFILLQINGIVLSGYNSDLNDLKSHILNNDNVAVESWINLYAEDNI